MELHGQQLLAGGASAEGSELFHGVDPTTGATLQPPFIEATRGEIDQALAAAVVAHRELRELPAARRAALLEGIAMAIEDLGDDLLIRAGAETALPAPRLIMERGRTCNQLRMFAKLVREGSWVDARIDHGQPDRSPVQKPDTRRMLIAVGPVAVFGASNFPLAFSVAGGDTASALAAGCPVVVKAHPNHPGTSELVGRAIQAAVQQQELPGGVFALVQGATVATGQALVEHPSTRAVGFTGSLQGGRALFDRAMARPDPIPVYAEMGSTNPVFLLPGALAGDGAQATAAGLHQALMLGVGQFCTNPGLVITVGGTETVAFLEALGELVAASAPGTMLHTGIRSNYAAGLSRLRHAEGVRELAGGSAQSGGDGGCVARAAVFATDATTWLGSPALHDEVFGPATLVVLCDDVAQMHTVAENTGGQLTATVHGSEDDLQANSALLRHLEQIAGRVIVNGYPTGVEVCSSMQHGGPYPATTDARSTSVGAAAIERFARPVCYQDMPQSLLRAELRDDNPAEILREVNGLKTRNGSESR